MVLIKCRLMNLLQTFSAEGYLNKKMLLYQLKDIDYCTLDELAHDYYYDRIKPNLIRETVSELERLKSENYLVYVVSAGYDIYLKYAMEDLGIDGIISTKLDFCKNKFTGYYLNKDCLGEYKIKMIKEYLSQMNVKGENSIAYSDSNTDLPLLNYCNTGVVVCKSVPAWAIENRMEVLLWE